MKKNFKNPFYYIFYRISEIYIKTGVEIDRPDFGGSAVVSLFQFFNLTSILFFFFSIKMTILLGVILVISINLSNWLFFYTWEALQMCKKNWSEETRKSRIIKGSFIVLYLLISIYFYGITLSRF